MMSTQQKTDVNVIAIENNSYSNAALDDEGRVWTWGNSNIAYRLGRASSIASNTANPFNRGGQVTTTIYSGEVLPFILQISGSYQNTLALDRDGNVWSWGITTYGALGRTGNNALPGKVAFPTEVKIKWIAAANYGGKAIDSDGNIWVWGRGNQSGLGTGNTTDVSIPVKLTLDSSNKPLPSNFTKISSSDYFDRAAAIAITEDGKIFTWGNTADAARGGASRPRQTGFHADIKKIDVGNGTYGFLTNSGELWTWGDNAATAGGGRQGHGDSINRAAPKRVENVINSGTKPAPKFKDFSLYAWSMCAVDHEGNIYGTGENRYSKHGAIGTPNRLTKYSPNGIPADTEIFIVAEGYTSTSYIDIYGNAYVTGESDARGNNHNDGSLPGPWVHFTGSGKPMFTVLSSTPTSEAKRYTTSPRTTLNAETNIACDEVKYVIIYPEDADRYTDGETFYSKSFAEIEQPYYLKDTNPQLLLSPNYDLWSSRYYANPKISEDVFNAAFDSKPSSEKGTMDVVSGSGSKAFLKAELVSHNCIVWIQSRNAYGTTRAIYRIDNYYTQTKVWFEGVKLGDPSFYLYPSELVGGGYGLFLDRQGKLIPGNPPFGYDIVKPIANTLPYWTLSPADQLDEEIAVDGLPHRVDRSKEIYLTELSQKGDDATKTPRVTFTYDKNPQMWLNATLYFVDESGMPVDVVREGDPAQPEYRAMFAPKDIAHVEGQDPYLPPEAVDPQTKVVGYSIGAFPDGSPAGYTKAGFPSGFQPVLEEDSTIYIVYALGVISVTESFIDISDNGRVAIKNNNGMFNSVRNFKQGTEDYDYPGPVISDYVIVGHEIEIGGTTTPTYYNWEDNRYKQTNAYIAGVGNNAEVRFLYKADQNGNRIPDDEEGQVIVRWIAVNANNAAYMITQQTICGNGKVGVTLTINHDKEHVLPTAQYDPKKWIFRAGKDEDTSGPYSPKGSDVAATVTLSVHSEEKIYFYYDEDYNENDIADKSEGHVVEKYKIIPGGGDLVPPKADTSSKWLGGQTYSKAAPYIPDYAAVGYMVESAGMDPPIDVERVEREQTGNVSVVFDIPFENTEESYTVTFLYMEDRNNNNIPDAEEGQVTIRWVGTTYAGNPVELAKLVLDGYIGDTVTDLIYLPTHIDDIWKFTGSNMPEPVILAAQAQEFTYEYIEVPEFATITIETKSTDGTLDFFYMYTKKLTDVAFDVTAFAIPTYRVKDFVHYDNYGNEISDGRSDTLTTDPSIGSQKIVFTYESTVTTVVIRAVDADNYTNVLESQTITDAVIGQKFSTVAPYVNDTWVLLGEVLHVIDVEEGVNYINFEYEKATGNVMILLKEENTSGRIIKVLSETVGPGTSIEIMIPDLEGSYYTQISTEKQTVDYNGTQPDPQTIEYYYTKNMMDVTIRAIDDASGTELQAETYLAAARTGESYMAIAPMVEWHTITESKSKSIYVDPAALDNTIVAAFMYKKDDVGNIEVRSFYKDKTDAEIELSSYEIQSLVGSKFTAIADSFPGFQLADEEKNAIQIIVNANNEIAFAYIDLRKTIGVFTQIESDTTTRKSISTDKYLGDSDVTIIPPYINDHLVVGYSIDTESMTPVNPEIFESLTLEKEDILDGMHIIFSYMPFQKIVDERYIHVTIQGVTDTSVHYSYLKRIAKSDLPLTLTAPADVFEVPAHVLDSASDFDVVASTTEKTFHYYPLATTLTIRMVDGIGNDVANSFTVGATAGAPFTYYAPNVPAYYLTGSPLGKADPVLTDGASEIIFTYKRITSHVTIVAKEDDAFGRIIGVFEVENPTAGTIAYDVPDLTSAYYTANQATVDITYDGTNSVRAEAYYTKVLAAIEIEAVDNLTNADLGPQTPISNQRKGEAVTVNAPAIAHYTFVGNATQIVIANGTNKAIFKYRPLENDEVLIKAVDISGNILQSYTLTGSAGEIVWADPPAILGWKTSDTAQSATIGTDREIVFHYTKNVVIVSISAVDTEGNPLRNMDIEVAKGGGYTAYAPHIAGYVLYGAASHTLTNLAADEIVTFVYKTILSMLATITVVGIHANGELYSYDILRHKNSGQYAVDARDVEGFTFIGISPVSVDVQEENETVTFAYESIYTTVTISMTDEDSTEHLAFFNDAAITGENYSFDAPAIVHYELTGAATGTISPVLPNGASEIAFAYKKS